MRKCHVGFVCLCFPARQWVIPVDAGGAPVAHMSVIAGLSLSHLIDNMIDSFVMPGQDVTDIIRTSLADEAEKYIVGPGLIRDEKKTKAMKSGRLRMRDKPSVFWVDSRQRRVSITGPRFLSASIRY